MALRDDLITKEAKRRIEEEERRKKQAARSQTVAVPRGEVGSFTKAYQGYKFVEEGTPEASKAKNLGEFIEAEAQRRFEAKGGAEMLRPRARTAEEESQAAREALAGRAEANRRAAAKLPSPLEKGPEFKLPGSGRVKFGEKTLNRMREVEANLQKEKAAQQATVAAAQEGMYRKWYDAAQKRYDEELASRGLVAPKTREEEAAFNAERMVDFRLFRSEREKAQRAEQYTIQEYRDFKRAARNARAEGNRAAAVEFDKKARALNEQVGGNITNATARRKFFEEETNAAITRELERRATERRASRAKQNSANPEATVDFASAGFTEQTPFMTSRNWTGMLSEGKEPFKRDTGALTAPQAGAPRQVPREAAASTKEETTPSEPPRQLPFPSTATTTRAETIKEALPGIESVPVVPALSSYREARAQAAALKPEVDRLFRVRFQPGNKEEYERVKAEYDKLIDFSNQEAKKVNSQVFDAYYRDVIIPSLDEATQSTLSEANSLNERLSGLRINRGSSAADREEAKKIREQLKPLQDELKKQIDALKSEKRKIGVFSGKKKELNLIDKKIAVLEKQI